MAETSRQGVLMLRKTKRRGERGGTEEQRRRKREKEQMRKHGVMNVTCGCVSTQKRRGEERNRDER